MAGDRRRPDAYTLLAILLSSLVASLVAIGFSAHNQDRIEENRRASDRALCGVVSTLDDSYRQTPPSTPAGKNLAEGLAGLRKSLGCDTRR